MSQTVFKTPRSLQVVQQEYTNLAARAGQGWYQREVLNKDLDGLYAAMRDLNSEAFAIQQAEAEKAQAEASAKKEAEESKPKLEAVPAPKEEQSNG